MAAGEKTIALNKKARHDFFIEETLETGVALQGAEVKSIRMGQINLKESYCMVRGGELWLHGVHISPYRSSASWEVDPDRDRRLLVHKQEIRRFHNQVKLQGLTIVPLRVYLKQGRVKLEIGLARGKKLYDKRDDDAKRTSQRDIDRAVRRRRDE